jgi:hypothetical protein
VSLSPIALHKPVSIASFMAQRHSVFCQLQSFIRATLRSNRKGQAPQDKRDFRFVVGALCPMQTLPQRDFGCFVFAEV